MAAEFGAQLTSLTMLRHPAQVVRSRDTAYLSDMDRQFRRQRETTNVAAWINAAFETERVTRGNPRAFVPYYDLIGDWRAAMTRAGKQLGLTYDGDLSGHHPVDDFIDAGLNRSQPDWAGLEVTPTLVDLAERSWDAMNALVDTPDDQAAMDRIDALREEYVDLYESSAAIALDETTAQVAKVRKKLKKQLATAEAEIARLKASSPSPRVRRSGSSRRGTRPASRRAATRGTRGRGGRRDRRSPADGPAAGSAASRGRGWRC